MFVKYFNIVLTKYEKMYTLLTVFMLLSHVSHDVNKIDFSIKY